MFTGAPPHITSRFGSLVGGTLLGAVLVATGLTTAYLTIATPFASNLAGGWAGNGGVSIGLGVWSFALIAGGGLLVSGTNQLAATVAFLRRGPATRGPAARALASWSDEIAVVGSVVPNGGEPIPELVIGAFGVAVVHALPSSKRVRHGPAGWESCNGDAWGPMDDRSTERCETRSVCVAGWARRTSTSWSASMPPSWSTIEPSLDRQRAR
jgi:hypothetical protein